jgi:hypothetical protein
MASGENSTKTGAQKQPYADPALDMTEQQKIDKIAMEMAKKGENEIDADEDVNPEDTEFTH